MDKSIKIAIIGHGSWGTAMGNLLTECGHEVILWGLNEAVAKDINENNENSKYIPGIKLNSSLSATNKFTDLTDCDYFFFVIPSQAIDKVISNLKKELADYFTKKSPIVISCTKGIDSSSSLRISEILTKYFDRKSILVLSGPSHAEEVAKKIPTAVSIAYNDKVSAEKIQSLFTVDWFRVYLTDDIAGMEIAGTIKNILAIASGICVGLGLGDNAQAALMTRGLAEMIRVGKVLGAKLETFVGLSGVGDLVVTCFSEHSRNFRYGKMIGQGFTSKQALENIQMIVEGVPNTLSVFNIAKEFNIRTPLIDEVYAVIYEDKSPKNSLKSLLSSQATSEFD